MQLKNTIAAKCLLEISKGLKVTMRDTMREKSLTKWPSINLVTKGQMKCTDRVWHK